MSGPGCTVQGWCPMGCDAGLVLGRGARVTCASLDCPRPDAAAEILADRETGHIVTFTRDGFTIRHPLRERLDDALMDCALHEHCASLPGPPVRPGKYRAARTGPDGYWAWVAAR